MAKATEYHMAVTGADFTLDPAYQLVLLDGQAPSQLSAIREVFTPKQVNTMSGKVAYVPDNYTLLSSDPSQHHFIGVQDEPDVFDLGGAAADFRFRGKYAKEAMVHKSIVNTMAEIEGGESLIQYLGAVAMGMVNDAYDRDGASVLKSTTLNSTVTATAAWSDPLTADPFSDFDKMVDKAGMADICWLGLNYARELSALPAFKDEAKNFDAKGGRIALAGVADVLMRRYEFDRVMIDGRFYNDANPAQTLSKKKIFDDVIWCGHSSHLIAVERADLREADNEFNSRSGNFHQ